MYILQVGPFFGKEKEPIQISSIIARVYKVHGNPIFPPTSDIWAIFPPQVEKCIWPPGAFVKVNRILLLHFLAH